MKPAQFDPRSPSLGTPATVTISVTLSQDEAWQLAQLAKRLTYTTCEQYADPSEGDDAPDWMNDAMGKVRRALAAVGVAPR